MSANKFRFYEVRTVVRANNQTEAIAVAKGRRSTPGDILVTEVDRISAAEARALAGTE